LNIFDWLVLIASKPYRSNWSGGTADCGALAELLYLSSLALSRSSGKVMANIWVLLSGINNWQINTSQADYFSRGKYIQNAKGPRPDSSDSSILHDQHLHKH